MIHLLTHIIGLSAVCPDSMQTCGLPTAGASSDELKRVLQIVLGIVGALAFLMIVVSGLRYVLSGDNPDRASRARSGIIFALIGMLIAILAEAIVSFVLNKV